MTEEMNKAAEAAAQKAEELHPDDAQALAETARPMGVARVKAQPLSAEQVDGPSPYPPRERSIAVHPAQMIEALIAAPDLTADKMQIVENLFDLQERFEETQAKKAYYRAVSRFQDNLPRILFDREVEYSGVEFEFASLANILRTIRPVLGDCGLTLTFRTGTTDQGNPIVTACLTHELGYGEDTTLSAPPDTSGKKNPIQAVRSTVSYLKRLTAEALLGLAAERDDDDDGGNSGGPADDQPQEKAPMPESNFETALNAARERLTTIEACAAFINKLGTKYTLSNDQVEKINACAAAPF